MEEASVHCRLIQCFNFNQKEMQVLNKISQKVSLRWGWNAHEHVKYANKKPFSWELVFQGHVFPAVLVSCQESLQVDYKEELNSFIFFKQDERVNYDSSR